MNQDSEKGNKMFYRISELADMFGVNESLLRYWEKEFPQISPKTNNRGVRLYRQEDIDTIGLIYHLVKERGMTLQGARQKLKDNKDDTVRNYEVVRRLQGIKEQLLALSKELEG
jgi:DNA-binding transcriptional MerR regulator